VPVSQLQTAVQAAGSLTDEDDATKERARVVSTRLARSATFRQRVFDKYGEQCALCGISLPLLLQAAHIFPVNLPNSSDATSNGVPLCLHHHALMDAHLLHIDPATLGVSLHPSLSVPSADSALAALAATTHATLGVPTGVARGDVTSWLTKRYAAYRDDYAWTH
jgi:hypothetical protein